MDFGASIFQAPSPSPPPPPPQEHHQQIEMDPTHSPKQEHDDDDEDIHDWLDEEHLGDERCYSTPKESLKGVQGIGEGHLQPVQQLEDVFVPPAFPTMVFEYVGAAWVHEAA
ncbi:hypothetical protein Scep_006924 [Stephania cephalantha]|uniref:Uncharacterized protein n=1 Tax=Stephania cephalantha TaxID=152367 RepID=A0AAP0K924_9MAGN